MRDILGNENRLKWRDCEVLKQPDSTRTAGLSTGFRSLSTGIGIQQTFVFRNPEITMPAELPALLPRFCSVFLPDPEKMLDVFLHT
jgi:hypothetical protein